MFLISSHHEHVLTMQPSALEMTGAKDPLLRFEISQSMLNVYAYPDLRVNDCCLILPLRPCSSDSNQ